MREQLEPDPLLNRCLPGVVRKTQYRCWPSFSKRHRSRLRWSPSEEEERGFKKSHGVVFEQTRTHWVVWPCCSPPSRLTTIVVYFGPMFGCQCQSAVTLQNDVGHSRFVRDSLKRSHQSPNRMMRTTGRREVKQGRWRCKQVLYSMSSSGGRKSIWFAMVLKLS